MRTNGSTLRYPAALASVLLIAAAITRVLASRLHTQKPRVEYGIQHLPLILVLIALLCVAGALYLLLLQRRSETFSTRFAVLSLAGAMAVLWVPVVSASHFVADDWYLLAAANVRQSLAQHPWLAWNALDTVDGNFRPLGTIVFLNHGFHWFGFYAGWLCCTIAAVLLYFIARSLGASSRLALCAGLLFASRDLLYGPIAWLSSLGDDLAILFGAACLLLVMRSLRARSPSAVPFHLAAFACFVLALLSKQSAYCIPVMVFLALTLRPGMPRAAHGFRQWAVAIGVPAFYIAACLAVFLHARHLLQGGTPYPVRFEPDSVGYLLRSVLWYFAPIELIHVPYGTTVETLGGSALLVLLCVLAWRQRSRLPLDDRAFAFSLLAGFAAIALFLLLPTRRTPYYGDFASYWISIAVAAVVVGNTHGPEANRRLNLLMALVVLGGASAELKRTALISSGAYLAGTSQMDEEGAQFAHVREQLELHPNVHTVVVQDAKMPESFLPLMICALPSQVTAIYVFNTVSRTWMVNDHDGHVPQDTRNTWTDKNAFHWDRPLAAAPAGASGFGVLTISAQLGPRAVEP